MSFTDHDTIAYDLYANTASANRYTVPAYWMWGALTEKTEISTVVENDGNTAARLVSNRSHWSESGNLSIIQNLTANLNQKYKVKFDYKTKTTPDFYVRLFWGATANIKAAANEWTTVEKEFTPTSASQQNVMFYSTAGGCQDILIDNVEVYLYDEATGEYGENLIKNGSFENSGDACEDVADIVTAEENGLTTVTWTNPSDATFLHTRVYLKNSEGLLFRGDLPANVNSCTIDAAGYEVVVKAVDKFGREAGFVAPVVPELDWEVNSFEILGADGEVAVTPGTGITAKAVISKYVDDVEISPVLFFGCYEGGKLEVLQILTEESASVVEGVTTYELTYGNAQSGKTYKAFVWDTFNKMIPVTEAITVNCIAAE